MGENLYVGSHKSSNKKYREGWERAFKPCLAPVCDGCRYEETCKNLTSEGLEKVVMRAREKNECDYWEVKDGGCSSS